MLGWYRWLDGHEFEQAPEAGDGQGSLMFCGPCGRRVRHDWVPELSWCAKNNFVLAFVFIPVILLWIL